MCGRYVITKPVKKCKDVVQLVKAVENNDNYNASPQEKLPLIKTDVDITVLENLTWGLIPLWAKNKLDFRPLINARLETLGEKKSFKELIKKQRCLIIADGYYEWKREGIKKIPHYFYRVDKKTIFFAGLFQNNGTKQFTIVTKTAEKNISVIHHRQPIIINKNDINEYLNLDNNGIDFLNSYKAPEINCHPVSTDVNKTVNNRPDLVNPV